MNKNQPEKDKTELGLSSVACQQAVILNFHHWKTKIVNAG